jgi:uncharacterized membrane protein
MPTSRREPSSVVWSWRGGDNEEHARAREAAAARQRGLLGGLIGLSIAAVFFFFLKKPVSAAVIAAVALLFTLLALLAPLTAYKALTRALDRFGHVVGTAITWLLLTVLYFLLFLPLGWFLRLRGKLGITRGFDPQRPSYWVSLEDRTVTPESYRRQF